MSDTEVYITKESIEEARQELHKAAMLWAACNIPDCPVSGVDIPDEDCVKYLVEQAAGIELDIKKYL